MRKQINIKAKFLLRAAAACLLFFAMGHSMGHFTRHNVTDPKAMEVQKQMMENKFDMFGKLRSYDENYTGMSLNLIFTLLTITILLWQLSGQSEKNAIGVRKFLVPLIICVCGYGITSAFYFFPMPAISCFIAAGLMIAALFPLSRENQ